jgi:hypothetical protein
MSITYNVYKAEPNMTEAKLELRCQSLGISTPHDLILTPQHWGGTLDILYQAEKLDGCSVFVTLPLHRNEVETLLGYAEAVGNDDWAQAINHLRDAYTNKASW